MCIFAKAHSPQKRSLSKVSGACLLGASWLLVFSFEVLASCIGTQVLFHATNYGWHTLTRVLGWLGVGTVIVALAAWLATLIRNDSTAHAGFARAKRLSTRLFLLALAVCLLIFFGAAWGHEGLFKTLAAVWIAFLCGALAWLNLEMIYILFRQPDSRLHDAARAIPKTLRRLTTFRHRNAHLLLALQDCLRNSGQRVLIERIACVERNLEMSLSIQTGSSAWKESKPLTLSPIGWRYLAFSSTSLEEQFPTWPGNIYSDVPLVDLPFEPCRLHALTLDDRAASPALTIVFGDESSDNRHFARLFYEKRDKRWRLLARMPQESA